MSKPKNMTCTAAQNACTCVSIKTIQYTRKVSREKLMYAEQLRVWPWKTAFYYY